MERQVRSTRQRQRWVEGTEVVLIIPVIQRRQRVLGAVIIITGIKNILPKVTYQMSLLNNAFKRNTM